MVRIPFQFLGKQEKFNTVEEAKEDPVMGRIYENTLKRHSFSAKNMHKFSLELSFYKVSDSHYCSHVMHKLVLFFFAEKIKKRYDQDRPKVLNIEHEIPSDLLAHITYPYLPLLKHP